MIHNLLHTFSMLLSSVALAAEEHVGPTHLTAGDSKRMIYHAIDLALLFAGLYYLAGAKLKIFFSTRGEKFDLAVKQAQSAREEAEHHNAQIKMKLKKLEESAGASLKKAEQDATEMKAGIIAEGRRVATRMAEDVDNTVRLEFERATVSLKDEFTRSSISAARADLKSSVNESEQRRLEREFNDKIQVR